MAIKDLIVIVTVCIGITGLLLAISITTAEPFFDKGSDEGTHLHQDQEFKAVDSEKWDQKLDSRIIPFPRLRGTVPVMDQADYRQTLGTCFGCTIESDGCLLVSLTMALKFLGVHVVVPAEYSSTRRAKFGMSPEILDDWFSWQGTYSYNSTGCPGRCLVDWYPLPGNVQASRRMANRGEYLTLNTKRMIDWALNRNYPVIAGVHWGARCHKSSRKTEDCHFVLITGKLGTTYQIIDPAGGIKTTLNNGTFGSYIIDHYRYLKRK